GCPLTTAMAVLAAAIPAAGYTLGMMAYPAALTALPEWAVPFGLMAGICTWIAGALVFGIPRASPDVEVALALAVVALRNDDPGILSRIERQYERYILDEPHHTASNSSEPCESSSRMSCWPDTIVRVR